MLGGQGGALKTTGFVLAAGALVLVAAFLAAYRIDTVADIFVDEITYFNVANNLANHANLSEAGNKPFYLHPPLFFVLEALYLRLTPSASGDIFAAVYHARYLNVIFHASTAAVLLAFGTRLYGRKVGLTAGVIFVADGFVNRINHRNMLETLAMLLVLVTLLALFEDIKRNRRWTLLLAGTALGLAVLTKEFMLPLVLVIMTVIAFRCEEAKRSRLLGIMAVGLLIYAVYPLWVWLGGDRGAFVDAKTYQIKRFAGFLQDTGWNRGGVSFYGALANRLQSYGATYALIGLGFPLAVLLWRRPGFTDRFVASWALGTYVFFAYDVLRGLNNDQFFYYLVIPPFVVVARSVWLGLAGQLRWESVGSSGRILGVTLALVLVGATCFNAFRWVEEHRHPDNGYERLHQFVINRIPPGAEINVTTELPVVLFPQYDLTSWHDIKDLERERPQYFIVSSDDARDRHLSTTQDYYQWVASHSREVFSFTDRSYGRLSVFELEVARADSGANAYAGANAPSWMPGYNNCGDITGDGRVTLHDVNIEALMLRFGIHPARYDVNRDGKLDYWDLLVIIKQLGASCRR